ncbi:MAG: cysteine--tRNA ligase [Methanotrichaceae archaeon]|nr:cysteine--tRNA ligase [Methanotrichaceae archaeon]
MMIYDTMSGQKKPLQPIHKNRVNIFVCGPTVYDDSHIGHARTYIAFDVVARYLRYKGFSVFYLQNITDVDDKIIQRASELDMEPIALARKFERRYLEDMRALGVTSVNLYARATEHIPEIIGQIERLMKKGFAYETETGVYFDESKFEDFGKLSHQTAEDLKMHRIEPDPTKRNPGDFSLWKKRPEGGGERDGEGNEEVVWDSPWGRGRPGWHIEDTAITETYFGPQYDIHGGAMDLIFPHHEAEIAQMEAASSKKPLVRCWMHTGFLNVKGEKMSKSLGNFVTIREMLEDCDPGAFRFFVLSAHYRTPIDFTEEALEQSRRSLERIRQLMNVIEEQLETPGEFQAPEESSAILAKARDKFLEAMDDDFNTPNALRAVFELVRDVNRRINEKSISRKSLQDVKLLLAEFGEVLGIDFSARKKGAAEGESDLAVCLIELLIEIRQKLREKKDWELADEIRDRLRDLNIVLEDARAGGGKYAIRRA